MYTDTSKHLYDISVLFENENIKNLLNNTRELNKLIQYKRKEENVRIGGINADTKIKDFNYFKVSDRTKSVLKTSMLILYNIDIAQRFSIRFLFYRLLYIFLFLVLTLNYSQFFTSYFFNNLKGELTPLSLVLLRFK